MSNNKLYTEEQVLKVWKAGQKYWETSGASITLEELLEHETPIELPSDEEIEKIAFRRVNGLTDYLTPKELNCLREGYINGMKLLINKIQGGNNEQQ